MPTVECRRIYQPPAVAPPRVALWHLTIQPDADDDTDLVDIALPGMVGYNYVRCNVIAPATYAADDIPRVSVRSIIRPGVYQTVAALRATAVSTLGITADWASWAQDRQLKGGAGVAALSYCVTLAYASGRTAANNAMLNIALQFDD